MVEKEQGQQHKVENSSQQDSGSIYAMDREGRLQEGSRVSLVGILANGFLAAMKMIVGSLAHSLAIFGDGLNNLFDMGSAILSLVSFKVSAKPSDEEHPFGHARFEYIASAMIGTAIVFTSYQLFTSSIKKIVHPSAFTFGRIQILSLVISIITKLLMGFYYDRKAKEIGSEVIAANAADARSDVIGTGSILLALFLSSYTPLSLDGPMSLAVSVLIFLNGYEILKDNFDKLIGTRVDAETYRQLEAKIGNYQGILGVHDLIIHDYGPGNIYLTASVMIDADQDVLLSHDTVDQISHDLYNAYGVHAVLHMDPIIVSDRKLNYMRSQIGRTVQKLYPESDVHDIQINDRNGKHSIDFDLALPWRFEIDDQKVREQVLQAIQKLFPSYEVDLRLERDSLPEKVAFSQGEKGEQTSK